MTPTVLFNVIGDGGNAFLVGHSLILAGAGHKPFAQVSLGGFAAIPVNGGDNGSDWQSVFPGESEVPFIMGRHSHNGAGAISSQHIVSDEDGNPLPI